MQRPRALEVLGPAALTVGILAAVGGVRDSGFESTAFADPPAFTQSAPSLPGGRPNKGDPPVFLNAAAQTAEQLRVTRELLVELRAIRTLLESGEMNVKVGDVQLDYERLSGALAEALPAGKASAGRGSGSTGGVRRITRGEETGGETSD